MTLLQTTVRYVCQSCPFQTTDEQEAHRHRAAVGHERVTWTEVRHFVVSSHSAESLPTALTVLLADGYTVLGVGRASDQSGDWWILTKRGNA